jgi:cytochrome c5
MLLGAGCSEKETTPTQAVAPAQTPAPQTAEPEASPPAEAPEPAAETQAADKPADAQAPTVDGQKIYQASCQACHAAGVAGAPKLGDKEAWAPRIAKGNEALFSSVSNGLNAMPPKGGCMSCSEDGLRAAIEYMVEQGS